MKRILAVLLFVSYIITLHSGKTDSNGGHWDYSTGTYHTIPILRDVLFKGLQR